MASLKRELAGRALTMEELDEYETEVFERGERYGRGEGPKRATWFVAGAVAVWLFQKLFPVPPAGP